ncbi:MAG: urease accessory protein UreF [Desulfobacteraceae bacterium]
MVDQSNAWMRLLHLVSPSLPTGAFAYSQGLEWAIEAGWICDADTLQTWLTDLIHQSQTFVDIPILKRMYIACRDRKEAELTIWCDHLLAMRESNELRLEEQHRGRAMATLLKGLQMPFFNGALEIVCNCQLAGFALAAAHWKIPLVQTATGYLWSWLENQVLVGIKTIPLGQTQGHIILLEMDEAIMEAVKRGLKVSDENIGASNPALAIASSLHETQYTRLYRS